MLTCLLVVLVFDSLARSPQDFAEQVRKEKH